MAENQTPIFRVQGNGPVTLYFGSGKEDLIKCSNCASDSFDAVITSPNVLPRPPIYDFRCSKCGTFHWERNIKLGRLIQKSLDG